MKQRRTLVGREKTFSPGLFSLMQPAAATVSSRKVAPYQSLPAVVAAELAAYQRHTADGDRQDRRIDLPLTVFGWR